MKQECEALQNDSDFDHGENAPTQPALCWKGQEAPGEPEHHGLLERAHKGALKQITTPGLFELLVHFPNRLCNGYQRLRHTKTPTVTTTSERTTTVSSARDLVQQQQTESNTKRASFSASLQ